MQQLTNTHVKRWKEHRHETGYGHLYRLRCLGREDSPPAVLSAWPLPRPANWVDIVNEPQTEPELAALRRCVNRGTPYGDDSWIATTSRQLGLESTLRPRGRPQKETEHKGI
jgi:putative transposase